MAEGNPPPPPMRTLGDFWWRKNWGKITHEFQLTNSVAFVIKKHHPNRL